MKFSVELYRNYKYYDIQLYYVTVYSSSTLTQCVFCVWSQKDKCEGDKSTGHHAECCFQL